MKCRRVSWGIGDVGYEGRVSIWLDNAGNGAVWWFYSMRVKLTNWYCWDRKRQATPTTRASGA